MIIIITIITIIIGDLCLRTKTIMSLFAWSQSTCVYSYLWHVTQVQTSLSATCQKKVSFVLQLNKKLIIVKASSLSSISSLHIIIAVLTWISSLKTWQKGRCKERETHCFQLKVTYLVSTKTRMKTKYPTSHRQNLYSS